MSSMGLTDSQSAGYHSVRTENPQQHNIPDPKGRKNRNWRVVTGFLAMSRRSNWQEAGTAEG